MSRTAGCWTVSPALWDAADATLPAIADERVGVGHTCGDSRKNVA